MTQLSFRDVEMLNAYLDGQLDSAQHQRLESRLHLDPELKTTLDALRESRSVLRRLPQRRAPRNFTLTPKMAGIKPPLPRAYPAFRFASVFAAVLLFFTYATNFLPRVSLPMGAAAPASMQVGVGGGGAPEDVRNQSGGGCDSCTPEATIIAVAPLAPAEKVPASDQALPTQLPEPEQPFAQTTPSSEIETAAFALPPLTLWQALLFIVACLAGGAALIIRLIVERRWAKANAVSMRLSWRDILLIIIAVLLITAAFLGLVALLSGGSSLTSISLPVVMISNVAQADSGLKGGVGPQGDKGGFTPARFSLDPSMGYGNSYTDLQGYGIALLFPAGSFDVPTDLQISFGQGAPTPSGYVYAGRGFQLYTVPNSLPLRKPLTVTVNYSDEDVSLVPDKNQLLLMFWNGSDWVDAAALCNPVSVINRSPDENKIQIDVCDVGGFAMFAPVN
jgi:hypothetical protein